MNLEKKAIQLLDKYTDEIEQIRKNREEIIRRVMFQLYIETMGQADPATCRMIISEKIDKKLNINYNKVISSDWEGYSRS